MSEQQKQIEAMQKFVKELSAKHVALDQMYTEGMKSNHDLRTQLLFANEKAEELNRKIQELEARLKYAAEQKHAHPLPENEPDGHNES